MSVHHKAGRWYDLRMPDTTPLSYDDRGRGTPLVLLHGYPLDRRMWRNQLDALSSDFRVIASDLRGFGQSPRAAKSFSLGDLADDVYALMGSLGLSKVVLCGLSMGGYIAGAFAARYPAALAGLILVDTKAEADTADGKAARDKMIALVREKGSTAVAEQMMPKMLAPATLKENESLVKELRAMMEACPVTTLEYAQSAMRERPDYTADFARLGVPTLVIVGEQDAMISSDIAKRTAASIPGATLHMVPGAGHLAPMENPADVNGAIRTFMSVVRV